VTLRQFWTIVVVVIVMTLARQFFGERAVVGYFVLVGALGILGTVGYFRRRRRIVRGLGQMSKEARERTLMLLENNPLRAGLVADLDVDAPTVPLRGAREVFHYPSEAARTGRWTMYGCAWLAAFFAIGALSDVVLGTHRFVGSDTNRWEIPMLGVGFAAAALFMWWSVRETQGTLEITDEAMTWIVPGRTPRRIAWREVTQAKLGEFPQSIRVRSQSERIGVSDTLVDFGRAINLVATRLPASALRRAR
jgi:hypothetical protein